MIDEGWTTIAVPTSRVREFYALILEGPGGRDDQASRAEPSMVDDAAMEDTVRRVYRESPAPLRKFFDLLAARPDAWVSTEEVMAVTRLTARQWPQQLSALARRGRTRYDRQRGAWPFEGEKLYESGKQTWRYRMPAEFAEIIRSPA